MEDLSNQQPKAAEGSNLTQIDWRNFQLVLNMTSVSMACPQLKDIVKDCNNISDVIMKIRQLSGLATIQEALFLRESVRAALARQRLAVNRPTELEISRSLIELVRDSPQSAANIFMQVKQELKLGRIDVANSYRVLLTECLLAGGETNMKKIVGVSDEELRSVFAKVESTFLRLQQQENQQFNQEVGNVEPVLG